jgi:phosphoenolpyruvate synthase/pyruvate phosphate dikinase
MSEEGSFGRVPVIVKPIYFFDEADGRNKMLLGGKGAGLAEMTKSPAGVSAIRRACVYAGHDGHHP